MQDRYVGDVGDYGKYALLRALTGSFTDGISNNLSLAVNWCFFPDEYHNDDGRHITYLDKGDMKHLDPELHDYLKHILESNNRKVSAIEKSNLFSNDTAFINIPSALTKKKEKRTTPTERLQYRDEWLKQALNQSEGYDLVFFDPDNGIEIKSVPRHAPKAGKYIFWSELIPFYERGQSMIIYHHLNRTKTVDQQIEEHSRILWDKFPDMHNIIPLVFRRGSCRVFWTALRKPLASISEQRIDNFLEYGWKDHFQKYPNR